MIIYFHTLGCKVNQYETAALEAMLAGRGHTISDTDAGVDACVVNTCAVTAESGRKSRQAIRRLKAKNPDAIVAVAGCYSQVSAGELRDLGIDVLYGSGDRRGFAAALERAFLDRSPCVSVEDPARRSYEELPAGRLRGHTRALLKIQDGCDNFCAYCVIPYARGRVRSLPVSSAANEARRLAEAGVREIVMTGIEIASYGRDLEPRAGLSDVLAAVGAAAPGVRLRLGSLEPRIVTPDFCRALADIAGLCPHFHLSLQSGCDTVLARMKRRYTAARFLESVLLLRGQFPNAFIAADLIVGFPGETDAEFDETLRFIERCDFAALHIFPYSPRPKTPAAAMPEQIANAVKRARTAAVADAAGQAARRYLQAQVGRTLSVLFETEAGGRSTGHSENYCEVTVLGTALKNTCLNVQISGVKDAGLWGEIIL